MEIMAGILISMAYAALAVGIVWAAANRLERKQVRCFQRQTPRQSEVASDSTSGTSASRPADDEHVSHI